MCLSVCVREKVVLFPDTLYPLDESGLCNMLRPSARYDLIAVIQLALILPSACFVNPPFSPTSHASLPRVAYNPAGGYLAAPPSQAPRLTQRWQQCSAVYPAPCHPTQQQPSNVRSVRSTSSTGLSALSLPGSKPDQQPFFNGRFAAICASALALYFAVTVLGSAPVAATAKETVAAAAEVGGKEHLHIGQKIAELFRRSGLPDWATLMTISAMPVVELRGGVPVGIWMGLPIAQVFVLCVVGNMVPIPAILLALKSPIVQKIAKPVLSRARKKAEELGDAQSQGLALTLFVGIPLPGTGAWTGAMGASLLGMPFQKAMLSIFLGVVSAGVIMSCLTLAGRKGALLATAVLAVFCLSKILAPKDKTD